ncbi:MAG: T9SS type A sorting domain-containing protein [bacterium]|nr:T9SS type A sorting domain-containing protein [bacterium]
MKQTLQNFVRYKKAVPQLTRQCSNALLYHSNLLKTLLLFIMFSFFKLGFSQPPPLVVSVGATWNSTPPSGYEYGMLIYDNVTLVIDGITLLMEDNAMIELFKGAHIKLINGATITSRDPSSFTWYGIYMEGEPRWPQYDKDGVNQGVPDQTIKGSTSAFDGVLFEPQTSLIMNNSNISYAFRGVESYQGGTVRISNNSRFDNCITAVILRDYYNPQNWDANASYLMNSTFQWDDMTWMSGGVQGEMILLDHVSGVSIGGVTIENNLFVTECNRGQGIKAVNSGFSVTNGGDRFCTETTGMQCETVPCNAGAPTRSSISRFSTGILHTKTAPGEVRPYPLGVRFTDFTDNMNAIKVDNAEKTRIADNTFTSTASENDDWFLNEHDMGGTSPSCHGGNKIVDIYLYHARGTKIYNNNFTYDSYDDVTNMGANTRGIVHILSNGDDDFKNLIKKNTFANTKASASSTVTAAENVTGIEITGNQPETEILCNEFTNMGIDVNLSAGSGGIIKLDQKNVTRSKDAGNKFSSLLTGRKRFDNSSNPNINYYYSGLPGGDFDPQWTACLYLCCHINKSLGTTPAETQDCEISCVLFASSVHDVKYNSNNFKIIPQPAGDEFKMVLKDDYIKYLNYSIFDMQGKLILTKQINDDNDLIINSSGFSNGMYVILLNDAYNKGISQKLLIQH